MKVTNNEKCTFCNKLNESIPHLFWSCNIVLHFWLLYVWNICEWKVHKHDKYETDRRLFHFQIVYTEGALMQVKVHAEVLDILSGSRDTTNDFYFIFDSCQPDLPCVVPRTYAGK